MEMENALVLVVSMVQILVNSIHTLMSAATGTCMNLFHCPPLDGHYGDGTGRRTGCLLSLLVNKNIGIYKKKSFVSQFNGRHVMRKKKTEI
jgi:hypothetical protein